MKGIEDKVEAMSLNEPLLFIPPWKIYCYISGKLRKDTPEDHIRQRIARSLVEEYGYAKEDIGIEFPIKIGNSKKELILRKR